MLAQEPSVSRLQDWVTAVMSTPGVTPKLLEDEAGVSRTTMLRMRTGETTEPNFATVRSICCLIGSDANQVRRYLSGAVKQMPPIAGLPGHMTDPASDLLDLLRRAVVDRPRAQTVEKLAGLPFDRLAMALALAWIDAYDRVQGNAVMDAKSSGGAKMKIAADSGQRPGPGN